MNLLKEKNYQIISGVLIIFISSAAFVNTAISSQKENATFSIAHILDDYVIDQSHSSVSFKVSHLGISTVTGLFKEFKGTFKFNPQDFSKTQLEASAETKSLDTSIVDRDNHLKKPEYFDVEKHPTMTFKSTSVKQTGEKTFDLLGDLTIKGITKPTTFKVTYGGAAKSGENQGFEGTAEIKRKEFGIDGLSTVGELITINISTEGIRKDIVEKSK